MCSAPVALDNCIWKAYGFGLGLHLHMADSCLLAAEKIACGDNERKSNMLKFQIVSIIFSKNLIGAALEECQKRRYKGKDTFQVN